MVTRFFIAMEFLDGVTLKHRIAARPLRIEAILQSGPELADALEGAHAKGIIYRDVKPANISITDHGHAVEQRPIRIPILESKPRRSTRSCNKFPDPLTERP